MSIYDERPWLDLYSDGVQPDMTPNASSALDMFKQAAQSHPERAQIHYFSRSFTTREVDTQSDALAVGLIELGLKRGDRVAVYLQNVPQFVFTLIAVWKVGAIFVPINPMLRERELTHILADAEVRFLVTLESLFHQSVVDTLRNYPLERVISTSELDYLDGEVPGLLANAGRQECTGTIDFVALLARHAGRAPPALTLDAEDVAILPYTSGTTGAPKGAMNTHANVVFNCEGLHTWFGMQDDDVIFALAPLFHITGLIGQLGLSLCGPFPLVLSYRFDAQTAADLIEKLEVTYCLGAITAFIALMNTPSIRPEQLRSLRVVVSGGAPIAPAHIAAFRERFSITLRSAYGLTETTAPSHVTPRGQDTPVDPNSGALAIGVPYIGVSSRIVDDAGEAVPAGVVGEIAISGPMVVPGYWRQPEETAKTFFAGEMRTGDVGFMDEQGWFYIVDRKKDMIIASGYKVWPREVEDVLYTHPAVREAAVVGVADDYRGETVKAFISMKTGETTTPEEIKEYCRDRMAVYKRPHQVEVLDELPKTASGKILRRQLRV